MMPERFLVLSTELPKTSTGGGVLLGEIYKQLSTWGSLHAVVPCYKHQESELEDLQREFSSVVESWTTLRPKSSHRGLGRIGRLISPLTPWEYNFSTHGNVKSIADLIRSIQPTKVLAISSSAFQLLQRALPQELVSTTHLYFYDYEPDLFCASSQTWKQAINSYLSRIKTRRSCLASLKSASYVAAITRRDAERYRLLGEKKCVAVINPVMHPNLRDRNSIIPNRAVLMTNFNYEPNRVSLVWFLDKVFPHISRSISIVITGRDDPEGNLSRLVSNVDNVTYRGCLSRDDLEKVLSEAAFTINPTRAGGGFQIKLLDSLARNIPAVTTNFSNPFGGRLASSDDPVEFARLINDQATGSQPEFDYESFYGETKRQWAAFLNIA